MIELVWDLQYQFSGTLSLPTSYSGFQSHRPLIRIQDLRDAQRRLYTKP